MKNDRTTLLLSLIHIFKTRSCIGKAKKLRCFDKIDISFYEVNDIEHLNLLHSCTVQNECELPLRVRRRATQSYVICFTFIYFLVSLLMFHRSEP